MENSPKPQSLDQLDESLFQLSKVLASVQLSAYAVDAMRVLQTLDRQATQHPDLHATIRAACPDWRNPGSLQDPADCIANVLGHTAHAMDHLLADMRQAVDDVFNP
jgi:hypothetical protein